MEKALFLYSGATGTFLAKSRIRKALEALRQIYEVEAVETHCQEELISRAEESRGRYFALIVAGGDGTFHHVVNALAEKEDAPVLGYLNMGTMGDVGKLFGVSHNLRRSLKILEDGHSENFDLGKANGVFFAYMAATGAFSDVSYRARRPSKIVFGRLCYYWLSFVEAFQKISRKGRCCANGEEKDFEAPFLLAMNGRNVGGFRVSRYSNPQDGKLELFLTPKGCFNGLLSYLRRERKFEISVAKTTISLQNAYTWCLDGEEYEMPEKVEIGVAHAAIRVFCKGKQGER